MIPKYKKKMKKTTRHHTNFLKPTINRKSSKEPELKTTLHTQKKAGGEILTNTLCIYLVQLFK